MEKLSSRVRRWNIINPSTPYEFYYSSKITKIGDNLCKVIKPEQCIVCGEGEAFPKWELFTLEDGCTYAGFFLKCGNCRCEYQNGFCIDLGLLGVITQSMNKEVGTI